MKSVDDHLAGALDAVEPLPALELPLFEARDCVLMQDVVSPIDLPLFDNSSMDGYAVMCADVAQACAERPVALPVIADVPAGSGGRLRLTRGSAVRIMTGAPMPEAAEAVVPVEWTDGGVATVQIRQSPGRRQHVRRAGEDVRAGETVLRAGTRLTSRHVALLAAVGRDQVPVCPRPRVVVISTGSELVPPGRTLRFGQIHDSNGFGLTAAAIETGAVAYHVGLVADDAQPFLRMLEDQLVRADLVVTSGGVSAGAFDTVKEVLSKLGTVRFDRVAMQPGMPQGFGTVGPDATPIFALPGNPVSAMVSFEIFVRPVLRKMWGESQLFRPSVTASAAQGWPSPPGKRQFVRARLEHDETGPRVTPVGGQGSHLVADLAEASCLAVVPEDVTAVHAGDTVQCLPLERGTR